MQTERSFASAGATRRPLLTWEQAAERLGTSVEHLKRIIWEGGPTSGPPPPYVEVGGRVRFNPDDLALRRARPRMPEELTDRQQDACEPLLAIADRMGKPWSVLARLALVELCTGERLDDVETMRLTLLRDLKSIFGRLDRRKLSTAKLLAELHKVPESPWRSYYGRPLEDRDMAGLLKHYGISSRPVRVGRKVLRGYHRDDLHDAWGGIFREVHPELRH